MSFLPYNLFGAIPDMLMGRNPKDALLGNAMSTSAAMAAPGMLGSSGGGSGLLGNMGEAAGTSPSTLAAFGPAQPSQMFSGGGLLGSNAAPAAEAGGGLLDGMNKAANALKPIGSAADSASKVYGIYDKMNQRPQIQASPMIQSSVGPSGLSAMVGQTEQSNQQRMADEMQRRMRQRQLISGIGGR